MPTTSGSGTSVSKNRKLSEEANTQGYGLDVGNEVIDEIVCKIVAPRLVATYIGELGQSLY